MASLPCVFSNNDAIPRCWAHRCPGGTRCLQGVPFFVRAPHITRPTVSGVRSEGRLVTVSRADTDGVEALIDWLFGDWLFSDWPFRPGWSVLFNAKTTRVAQISSPATVLK